MTTFEREGTQSIYCAHSFLIKLFSHELRFGTCIHEKYARDMLTAAAILEADWRTASMDYHTLMKLTRILSRSNAADTEQMFRRMCFNVFAHNRDDHAKNFTWIYDEAQDCWHPSPAYDLTWSTTYFGEHTTTVDGNGKNPGLDELMNVGKQAGMSNKLCRLICKDIQEKVRFVESKYHNIS